VHDSLTDLAGLRVGAEGWLAALLEVAARPIWVVDHDGVIRFASLAAVATLGYDSAGELLGCRSHQTIHGRHSDGTPVLPAECPVLRPLATGETVARDLDWFFRRDGSRFAVSFISVPLDLPEGRGAVVAFTDIEDRLRTEQVLRERDARLGARDDSLRRIAALVARGAASADVFAAIAAEVAHVLGVPLVVMLSYDPDGTKATVIGGWSEAPHPFQTGTRWPLDGPTLLVEVLKTGRPARIDDYSQLPGTIADAGRKSGFRAAAGAPIIVDGEVWGAMTATAGSAALPDQLEDRLAEFTELVATAISNAESRGGLARLAEEQAALRRVATLVARGASPEELFAAVVEEVGRVFGVANVGLARYESGATMTTVAISERLADAFPVGVRWPLGGKNASTVVFETGRPARIEYGDASGQLGVAMRNQAFSSSVGAPIVVEGRVWGVLTLASTEHPLPADSEARLASFSELVATAMARIVVATDEERRRVVRDLHDGAQQRLVHTVITLKLAQKGLPNQEDDLAALVTEALDHAEQAMAELRELAHGILPAVLTQGGLHAGVEALASRMPVPVENAVSVGRLPAAVEATAYFVVAEALTNVAKHARARRASVRTRIEDGAVQVQVRDDGVGGARPDGNGLIGLADRLTALGGELRIDSPAQGGTLVAAAIPLPG
jgi:PAS domain S-box-containing protein